MAKGLIIQYTNLLHRYRDLDAPKVKQFMRENSQDPVFVKRAEALNVIFKLKEELSETRGKTKPSKKKAELVADQLRPHTVH